MPTIARHRPAREFSCLLMLVPLCLFERFRRGRGRTLRNSAFPAQEALRTAPSQLS